MKLPGIPFPIHTKNGRYYRVSQNKWIPLTRVEDGLGALERHCANITSTPPESGLPAAITRFLKSDLPRLTPAVRKEQERMFAIIADSFADFAVDQVRPRDCRDFLNAFAGARVKQTYKASLSRFFSWCVVEERCQVNPLREITVKRPVKHLTPWTDELFLNVADQLDGMLLCYHWLSYYLFQRAHDVRLLTVEQTSGDYIRERPSKTAHSSGKTVDIKVTANIRHWLNRAREEALRMGTRTCPYVIHTPQGTAYTASGVRSAYRRIDLALHNGKRVGLNARDLRSYAATSYDKSGGSLKELSKALAHTNRTTTAGYIHQHTVPTVEIDLQTPERQKDMKNG